ncbi:glycosyltransferase [Marinifilum caeruleilacunae]|uniref:Glycosyltransferase n=1 Tax=Marinifilum caeruleilacunae TaxID=2499076 RepID=A0ABX1WQN9_9BACT|nr:glycosyltransferase [Marinifilum caeruleilacunae]NOU58253.1 glycosyltransferase [Marinifilum caeruleilacunae]
MRITYVSTYPPTECGIATYTQYLSNSVANYGKEIRVLAQIGAKGNHVFETYAPHDKDIAAKLFFHVERHSPDIVHVEHEFGLFGDQRGVQIVEFLIRCQLADTPVVVTLHTVFEDLKYEEKNILQHILNFSTAIVVHESFQKEILLQTYECPKPIVVIPHGVREVERVKHAKNLLGLEGKQVLLLAGYMRSTKNFEKIIKLMPQLIERNKDLVLLMASRTRINEHSMYKEKLYREIDQMGLKEHVKILYGKFPQYTLDTILSAADVMALPYSKGAQSGVLAQAAAMLLPVVTSELMSFKNWINEVRGGFYASSDDEYVSHISHLLQDDDLRTEFQNNIRENNKKISWTNIASRHIKLYRNLLKSPVAGAQFYFRSESINSGKEILL